MGTWELIPSDTEGELVLPKEQDPIYRFLLSLGHSDNPIYTPHLPSATFDLKNSNFGMPQTMAKQ